MKNMAFVSQWEMAAAEVAQCMQHTISGQAQAQLSTDHKIKRRDGKTLPQLEMN